MEFELIVLPLVKLITIFFGFSCSTIALVIVGKGTWIDSFFSTWSLTGSKSSSGNPVNLSTKLQVALLVYETWIVLFEHCAISLLLSNRRTVLPWMFAEVAVIVVFDVSGSNFITKLSFKDEVEPGFNANVFENVTSK